MVTDRPHGSPQLRLLVTRSVSEDQSLAHASGYQQHGNLERLLGIVERRSTLY